MSSFSGGLAQGASVVNNVWRTLNNKEYQDKQLGLREADQALREHEYEQNDQFRRDNMAQQKQMHDDTIGLQRDIQKENSGLRAMSLQIQAQQAAAMNQWRQFQEQVEAHRQAQTELQPLAAQAVQIVHDGGTLPEDMVQKLSVPGSPFNPALLTGKDYAGALDGLIQDVNKDPSKWNTPENVKRASTIFSPELNSMVGQVDPGNGKTIKNSVFTRFIPSPDGKSVAPEVKTEYTDGSSDTGPLTKYRSSHPDDVPIAIPLDKISQQVWARKAYSHLLSKDPNVKAVADTGEKTVRQAAAGKLADLEGKRLEADAKLRSTALGDPESQKTLKENIAENDKSYQALEDRVTGLYGLPARPDTVKTDGEGQQRATIAKDKDFPGFSQVMADKKWDVNKLPLEQLTSLFGQYKDSVAKNAQATSMANQMRQNYQHQN